VFDGSSDVENCTIVDQVRFSYNQGIHLFGAAVMYNISNTTTDSTLWKTRVDGLLASSSIFFKDSGIMYEAACEQAITAAGTCNQDQLSFKAYLSRWMAATAQLVPETSNTIMTYLKASATAAAAQCDGGTKGTICGEHWTANSTYDGTYGVGQQMSALSVIQSNLIMSTKGLVTNDTGGTSAGDAAAGTSSSSNSDGSVNSPTTTADRVGAGILTAMLIAGCLGGVGFLVTGV
jgi:mannan endo-1,6-alpha-mannosidase